MTKAEAGSKGGKAKSEAKLAACLKNGFKLGNKAAVKPMPEPAQPVTENETSIEDFLND